MRSTLSPKRSLRRASSAFLEKTAPGWLFCQKIFDTIRHISQPEMHFVVERHKLVYPSSRKGGMRVSFKFQFSGDLRRMRESKGWTQPFVAGLVSITLREYQNIEGGKCVPSVETFLRLVYLFDLDIENYREEFDIYDPLFPI